MRPAGPALMECCQPLYSAGPERCPLPMVLTEAVPVSPIPVSPIVPSALSGLDSVQFLS